jgi:hypothetical protein
MTHCLLAQPFSQYAKVGPAMLAPEMRTSVFVSFTEDSSCMAPADVPQDKTTATRE